MGRSFFEGETKGRSDDDTGLQPAPIRPDRIRRHRRSLDGISGELWQRKQRRFLVFGSLNPGRHGERDLAGSRRVDAGLNTGFTSFDARDDDADVAGGVTPGDVGGRGGR